MFYFYEKEICKNLSCFYAVQIFYNTLITLVNINNTIVTLLFFFFTFFYLGSYFRYVNEYYFVNCIFITYIYLLYYLSNLQKVGESALRMLRCIYDENLKFDYLSLFIDKFESGVLLITTCLFTEYHSALTSTFVISYV